MAQYGEHNPYAGHYAQQYQQQPPQYPQTQYYPQTQSQDYNHYNQTQQQPASYQYAQPYQQHQQQQQQQPSHQYPSDYPQQYPQQYSQQHVQQPQQPQQHPQQYPQQYAQQNPYVNGYSYGQGHAQPNSYPTQYQGVTHNPNPTPNQAQPHSCYNCGRPDHFAHACSEPRKEVVAGGINRHTRFPAHQPQQSPAPPTGTNLSRASSFTQQGSHYGQSPQVQSPHPNTPQTPYAIVTPQWQASPQHQNPQMQNHEARWQNQQYSPNTPHVPQFYQGYQQSSNSPVTPFTGSQFCPPPQLQAFQAPSHRESINTTPLDTSTNPPAEPNLNVRSNSPNGDLTASDPDPADLEDDLSKLDVPDEPAFPFQHGDCAAKLVSQVLPSNFIVADALYPLAIPPPEAEGKCQSRFFHNKSEKDSLQDFRASPLWRDRQEDTIFCLVEDDDCTIKLEECLIRVKERRRPRPEESLRQTRQQSQSIPVRSAEAIEMADALAKVEKALADAKAKEAEMLANRRKAKAHQVRSNGQSEKETKKTIPPAPEGQPQSARRSSEIGVNGQSHSYDSRKFPLRSEDRRPSADRMPPQKRSNTSLPHINGPRVMIEGNANQVQQHGQTANSAPQTASQSTEMMSPSNLHHGSPDLNRRSSFEGRNAQSHNIERPPPTVGHDANFSRKRNYESRAESSSDEDDDSPRRQETDVTPKYNKRRPPVAAAYSRRW